VDWQAAIHYAKMVQAAEEVLPAQVCGQSLTIPLRGVPTRVSIVRQGDPTFFPNSGEVKFP
jgi:hypothetical protein